MQVKPFQDPYCIGYEVICCGKDFKEHEGTVFFDTPPKIGETATLSDGKLWRVTKESDAFCRVEMEIVE